MTVDHYAFANDLGHQIRRAVLIVVDAGALAMTDQIEVAVAVGIGLYPLGDGDRPLAGPQLRHLDLDRSGADHNSVAILEEHRLLGHGGRRDHVDGAIAVDVGGIDGAPRRRGLSGCKAPSSFGHGGHARSQGRRRPTRRAG